MYIDIIVAGMHSGEPHTSVEHQRHDEGKSSRGSLSDMEKLWKDVLKEVENSHTQKFLQDQAKLALLCISRSNANLVYYSTVYNQCISYLLLNRI